MSVTRVHVAGISCQGCARAIAKALEAVRGVDRVDVDVTTKLVSVTHRPTTRVPALLQALEDAGYPPGAHASEP